MRYVETHLPLPATNGEHELRFAYLYSATMGACHSCPAFRKLTHAHCYIRQAKYVSAREPQLLANPDVNMGLLGEEVTNAMEESLVGIEGARVQRVFTLMPKGMPTHPLHEVAQKFLRPVALPPPIHFNRGAPSDVELLPERYVGTREYALQGLKCAPHLVEKCKRTQFFFLDQARYPQATRARPSESTAACSFCPCQVASWSDSWYRQCRRHC